MDDLNRLSKKYANAPNSGSVLEIQYKQMKEKLFKSWSNTMDKLYGDSEARHNAELWDKGDPSQWMDIYNEELFREWCDDDAGVPPEHLEMNKN